MKKYVLTIMLLLLSMTVVSADNETNSTLDVCDLNNDGARTLTDVTIFATCKDTFDANGDGVHDLSDVVLYAQNNQNNTWCQTNFVCEVENESNETEIVDFSLIIEEPEEKEYDDEVDVRIESNETLEVLTFTVGNYTESCNNCSNLEDELELEEGNYSLKATGKLGNITKESTVEFSVVYEVEDNETDEEPDRDWNRTRNETGSPRFDLGFEKLPQLVESGEITDEELAEIIRENKLNPGILNRLIKTGKLGNESLELILDTQFKPVGIFGKIMSFFGVSQDTYAENIYENYDLPKALEQKIVSRDDLPNKYKEKVKEELRAEEQKRIEEPVKIGQSDNLPPGQEKKSLEVGKQEVEDKGNSENSNKEEKSSNENKPENKGNSNKDKSKGKN